MLYKLFSHSLKSENSTQLHYKYGETIFYPMEDGYFNRDNFTRREPNTNERIFFSV